MVFLCGCTNFTDHLDISFYEMPVLCFLSIFLLGCMTFLFIEVLCPYAL